MRGLIAVFLSLGMAGWVLAQSPPPAAAQPMGPAVAAPAPPARPVPVVVPERGLGPALVQAAMQQDSARALDLIAHGADVNARSSDGTSALMWAAHFGERPLIARLLQGHADVRATNDYGASAMSEAATFGDTSIIDALLRAGADPDSANADGMTALMIIARTQNVAAARLLIAHGAHVNARERWRGQTALQWAAAQSQPLMVQELLRHHADPSARSYTDTFQRQVTAEPRVQARPSGGLTPLLYAARQGCIDCARYLLAAGADVNQIDPDGVTPLIMATENFHFDLAVLLIDKGADVNRWDWWGRTPLYAAVDLSTLPYGGRADHISLDATTPLKLMQILLEKGANPNARLKLFPPYRSLGADRGGDGMLTTGATPLLRAARAGDTAAIHLLLQHGADASLPNRFGATPLMAAAGIGNTSVDTRGKYKTQKEAIEAIAQLVAAGADVNAADERGDTALHGAASWGWNDVVRALVDRHADLQAKDLRGMTPIDAALGRAIVHGRGTPDVHPDTAKLLQQLIASNAAGAANPTRTAGL